MSKLRVGLLVGVAGLALIGASYFAWQLWFRPPKPIIPKLSISKYGTIIGITDSITGIDLTNGKQIDDGYMIAYQRNGKRKFVSVVGDSAIGGNVNGALKGNSPYTGKVIYYPGSTSAIVTLLDDQQKSFLKITSSFWVNPQNGEILISRAVVPEPDPFNSSLVIEAVETYSNNRVLASKASKKVDIDRASWAILDWTCWLCQDNAEKPENRTPICAATLTGVDAKEYFVCLNCETSADGGPRSILVSSPPPPIPEEVAELATRFPNRRTFPFGELGLGIPIDLSRRGFITFCAKCEGELPRDPRTGETITAYTIHAMVGEERRPVTPPECVHLIRYNHSDIPGDGVEPFAIVETRTIPRLDP